MFKILTFVLQLLWPFFKESLLQGRPFRKWLRENLVTLIWISLMLIMLAVVFWMADTVTRTRSQLYGVQNRLGQYQTQLNSLKKSNDSLKTSLSRQRREVTQWRNLILTTCPVDSQAYVLALRGADLIPAEVTARTNTETVGWCKLVREGDLDDDSIRRRFLKDCTITVKPPQG